MSVHYLVNGIVSAAGIPGDLAGPAITSGQIAALVTPVPSARSETLFDDPDTARDLALEHHERLVELVRHMDVLPIRLGAVYSSENAVREKLRQQEELFRSALAELSGQAEYLATLTRAERPAADETPSARSGRAYLSQRRQARRAKEARRDSGERLVAGITEAVRTFAASVVSEPVRGDRPREIGRIAFLAEKEIPERALAVLEDCAGHCRAAGVEMAVTGPWPPYSFTRGGA